MINTIFKRLWIYSGEVNHYYYIVHRLIRVVPIFLVDGTDYSKVLDFILLHHKLILSVKDLFLKNWACEISAAGLKWRNLSLCLERFLC